MFTVIKNLAELSETGGDITSFLAYPGSKTTTEAIFLLFETDNNGEIVYKGLSLTEELDESKLCHYLYPSSRPSQGVKGLKSPTVVYNDYDKSYKKKIFAWFESNKEKNKVFKKLFDALIKYETLIHSDLSAIKKPFLSIKIDNKYIGEIEQFKTLITSDDEITESISSKHGKNNVKMNDALCCICYKNNVNVFGFAIPYAFFTVDSPGFAYNFDQNNAVKQIPVCLECAKKIRGSGRTFLERELGLRLCGADYFLIPELINYSENKKDLLNRVIEKIKKGRQNLNTLQNTKADIRTVSLAERSLLFGDLANENNYLSLNFFFYKEDNSKFSILANIEEVLPSSLRKIHIASNEINELFKNNNIFIHTKKEDKPIIFDFWILSRLFENQDAQINKRSKKEFFEILNNLLTLRPISYHYIMNKIVEKIYKYSPYYIQGEFYKLKETLFESFLLVNLLSRLNLIEIEGSEANMTTVETPNLDIICGEFREFFNSPVKKAVFGLGILTEKLANIQYKDRESKSIYKKLRNFKVDIKFLTEKLLPELKDKFHAYKQDYPNTNKLFEEISSCLLTSNSKSLTAGETSYIFVLGINLFPNFNNRYFANMKESKELQTVN